MLADNPGTWLFHCHLNDHMDGGMMALFTIEGTAPPVTLDGKVRLYFVNELHLASVVWSRNNITRAGLYPTAALYC
jgi:hypothetical protein